jgi:hypothetical protein
LAASHVPRRCGHNDSSFHQFDQLIDLLGVVAPIGHGHHDDWRSCNVETEADGLGGSTPIGVERGLDPLIARRIRLDKRRG